MKTVEYHGLALDHGIEGIEGINFSGLALCVCEMRFVSFLCVYGIISPFSPFSP